jgi:1-aminocyclopropane-1-carboxylate deaminase
VELGRFITSSGVVLDTRYAYPEYGLPSPETLQAIRLAARLDGMITDPVYEGKSMQGIIDLIGRGEIPRGSRVLYAHSGGAPALNGYSFLFRDG